MKVVKIKGELSLDNSIELNSILKNLIRRNFLDITIDFKNCFYITAIGIGVLVHHTNELKKYNKKLILRNFSSHIERIFKMLKVDMSIFEIKEYNHAKILCC